jgi:hypothetical protein
VLILRALEMGPLANAEVLDLGPQCELNHAGILVMVAALGKGLAGRIATILQPRDGRPP